MDTATTSAYYAGISGSLFQLAQAVSGTYTALTNQASDAAWTDPAAYPGAVNTAAVYRTASNLGIAINGIVRFQQALSTPLSTQRAGIFLGPPGGSPRIANWRVQPYAALRSILIIGDSIAAGSAISYPPTAHLGGAVNQSVSNAPALVYNAAVSGTKWADWLPGGANLTSAISNAALVGAKTAIVQLGTNDCDATGPTPPAAVAASQLLIKRALNAAGMAVLFARPPAVSPACTIVAPNSNAYYLPAFWSSAQALNDGVASFTGSDTLFNLTLANPALLQPDGEHPNLATSRVMALQWAADYLSRVP